MLSLQSNYENPIILTQQNFEKKLSDIERKILELSNKQKIFKEKLAAEKTNKPDYELLTHNFKQRIFSNYFDDIRNNPPPLPILSQEMGNLLKQTLTIKNFIKDTDFVRAGKWVGLQVLRVGVVIIVLPYLDSNVRIIAKETLSGSSNIVGAVFGNASQIVSIALSYWKELFKTMVDPTLYEYTYFDSDTREYVQTISSNLIRTIQGTFVFGIPIAFYLISSVDARYRQTQSLTKTLFPSHFSWKVNKIRELKNKYLVPQQFVNDTELNQNINKCERLASILIFPMKTPQNKIFEYDVIEEWLLDHHCCPITGINLTSDELTFDSTIFDRIRKRIYVLSLSTNSLGSDQTENILKY